MQISSEVISIFAVFSSAAVSIATIWKDYKLGKKLEEIKSSHDTEMAKIARKNEIDTSRAKQQFEVFQKMIPYAVEFCDHDYSHRTQLLSYALKLKASAGAESFMHMISGEYITALTKNYDNRDSILWDHLLESCASAINLYDLTPDIAPQPQNHKQKRKRSAPRSTSSQ